MKWLLLLNLLFVIILFLLYKRDSKAQKPSKLNFKKNHRTLDTEFETIFKEKQENNDQYEKVLNILFQFNGETWDAYEVLGLPAGSNVTDAKVAYERALQEGKDSEAFLRAALDAIVRIKQG